MSYEITRLDQLTAKTIMNDSFLMPLYEAGGTVGTGTDYYITFANLKSQINASPVFSGDLTFGTTEISSANVETRLNKLSDTAFNANLADHFTNLTALGVITGSPIKYGVTGGNDFWIARTVEDTDPNDPRLETYRFTIDETKALSDKADKSNGAFESGSFGTSPNLSEFDTSGILEFSGDARMWEDANVGGLILRTGGVAPTIRQMLDNTGTGTGIYAFGFAIGNEGSSCIEIPHAYEEGTDIYFHIHYNIQNAPTGIDYIRFKLTYVFTNGTTVQPSTPIQKEIAVDTNYETGVIAFDAIVGTNIDIGQQFCFTIERIASTGDAFAGEVLIHTLGIHYQKDTVGSRTITAK